MKKGLLTLALVLVASSSFAHFQMLYTPESALNTGQKIDLRLTFTHPFADEHTMEMGLQHDTKTPAAVEEFYVINKDKKKDLLKTLKPITWNGNHNSAGGYATTYKARRMGDHMFVLQPAPYYEAGEDIYIQQITKVVINVAGTPTDWDKELGLKAEIVPLNKPYSIWTGSTFTGIVKRNGKVVPFADIEVEYINHAPISQPTPWDPPSLKHLTTALSPWASRLMLTVNSPSAFPSPAGGASALSAPAATLNSKARN